MKRPDFDLGPIADAIAKKLNSDCAIQKFGVEPPYSDFEITRFTPLISDQKLKEILIAIFLEQRIRIRFDDFFGVFAIGQSEYGLSITNAKRVSLIKATVVVL